MAAGAPAPTPSASITIDAAVLLTRRVQSEEARTKFLLRTEAELRGHLQESAFLGQILLKRNEELEQEYWDLSNNAHDVKRLAVEREKKRQELTRKVGKLSAEAESLVTENHDLQDRIVFLYNANADLRRHLGDRISSPSSDSRSPKELVAPSSEPFLTIVEEERALRGELESHLGNMYDRHALEMAEGKENLVELHGEISLLQEECLQCRSLCAHWQGMLHEEMLEAQEIRDNVQQLLDVQRMNVREEHGRKASQIRDDLMGIDRLESMFHQLAGDRRERRNSQMLSEIFQLQVQVVQAKQRLKDHASGKTVDLRQVVDQLLVYNKSLQHRAGQLEKSEREAVKHAAQQLECLRRWQNASRWALKSKQQALLLAAHEDRKCIETEFVRTLGAIRRMDTVHGPVGT